MLQILQDSNFYLQMTAGLRDLVVVGNSVMLCEEAPKSLK
ncbi:MAG: hypothetical protein IIC62_05480, partial [Proteobacteria bacterium]|nr:hypothetical protein [Pseudomonadota bacterium]